MSPRTRSSIGILIVYVHSRPDGLLSKSIPTSFFPYVKGRWQNKCHIFNVWEPSTARGTRLRNCFTSWISCAADSAFIIKINTLRNPSAQYSELSPCWLQYTIGCAFPNTLASWDLPGDCETFILCAWNSPQIGIKWLILAGDAWCIGDKRPWLLVFKENQHSSTWNRPCLHTVR